MIVPVWPSSPVITLLKNTSTEKWHPILYWECPFPSEEIGSKHRWKSKGHHTLGFETKEAAVSSCNGLGSMMELAKRMQDDPRRIGDVYYDDEGYEEWDGMEIPASVMFFDLNSLKKYHQP